MTSPPLPSGGNSPNPAPVRAPPICRESLLWTTPPYPPPVPAALRKRAPAFLSRGYFFFFFFPLARERAPAMPRSVKKKVALDVMKGRRGEISQ